MGAWSEDIYSNDIAMDTLVIMEENLNEMDYEESVNKFKEDKPYFFNDNETKLVLADLEKFHFGEIKNKKEIDDILEYEMSEDSIREWTNPERRLHYLKMFKDKINKESKAKSKKFLLKYIYDKRDLDIL